MSISKRLVVAIINMYVQKNNRVHIFQSFCYARQIVHTSDINKMAAA